MVNTVFDKQYKEKGIFAQRLYPNDALLCFLGGEGCFTEENHKQKKVLEIGCGSGANLWMMAKEGLQVFGMDYSEESLNLARKHLFEKWGVKADLQKGLFDDMPYSSNFFDYVVDVVSMQHIDIKTSEKALKEIFRVLKTGGKYFSYRLSDNSVMFFNGGGKWIDEATLSDITVEGMPLKGNGMISFWSPNTVLREYKKAGLDVNSVERNSRTYQNGLYSVEYLSIVAKK